MTDLNSLNELSDATKVGGGFGLGGLLTVLLARAFGSQDKVIARLEVLQAELVEVRTQLAILLAASERRQLDFDALKTVVEGHSRSIARLEARSEAKSDA